MNAGKLSRKIVFVDTEVVGDILEMLQKFSMEVVKDSTKPLPYSILKEYLIFLMFCATHVYLKNGIEKEDIDLFIDYFYNKLLEQKILSIDQLPDYEKTSRERYVIFYEILKKESGEALGKLIGSEAIYIDGLFKEEGEPNMGSIFFRLMADYMGSGLRIQGLITAVAMQLKSEENQNQFSHDEIEKKLRERAIEFGKRDNWPEDQIKYWETAKLELKEEEAKKLLADIISIEANKYLKDERLEEAEEKTIEALDLKDDSASAWGVFGQICFIQKKFPLAVLLFKMSIRYDKFFILNYYVLANAYGLLDNYPQALLILTESKKVIDSPEYLKLKTESKSATQNLSYLGITVNQDYDYQEVEKLVEDLLKKLREEIFN